MEVTMELPEDIRLLIYDLITDDECDYDHHGYCQAHGWFEESPCPHKRAKELLGTEKWQRVTVNTLTTPVLQVDEDGEWRVNIGDQRGEKNVLNYDIFPENVGSVEYWLVRKEV